MAKPNDYDFYCAEALSGKTKVKKVYESDKILAFHHTKPSFEFHVVVIPKEHIHDVTFLNESHNELLIEIFEVIKTILKDFDSESRGARLITNIGKFQDTPHLHFHIAGGKKLQDL